MVGSVLVKQSDLCTRLRKIGTERNVAPVLLLSKGFSGLPKNCNDGAWPERCDPSVFRLKGGGTSFNQIVI